VRWSAVQRWLHLKYPSHHHSPISFHLNKCFTMPPVRRSQTSKRGGKKDGGKKGGEKKRRASASTPLKSPSPLEEFFANYAPRFQYDATVSAPWEFYRLCDEFGWRRTDLERERAHKKFKDAIVKQFNAVYGTDVNNLGNWQSLCHIVRIAPVPDDLHACREAVYYSFINLVDLVDTPNTGVGVRVFESERDLSEYTISTGKFFPRDHALAGGLLRYLLRQIYHPRDGYSRARREGNGRR
jgi:hypothetical protein